MVSDEFGRPCKRQLWPNSAAFAQRYQRDRRHCSLDDIDVEPRTRARMYAAGAALPRVFLRRAMNLHVVNETIRKLHETIIGGVLGRVHSIPPGKPICITH